MAYAYALEETFVEDGTFTLERPTRARPKAGAFVLLFTRGDQDIKFTASSAIDSAPSEREEVGAGKWVLESIQSFESPRSIVELGGSLQRTRSFLEPWKDFKSWLVALSRQDFETIVDDNPAMPRTIYRSLFHALPLKLQAAFVRQHAQLFPGRRASLDYRELAPMLLDFLSEALVVHWQLLDGLLGAYPNEVDDFPELRSLWLASGGGSTRLSEGGVRFGADVLDLHSALGPFAKAGEGIERALLDECRGQLEEAPAEPRKGGRRWIDPIF